MGNGKMLYVNRKNVGLKGLNSKPAISKQVKKLLKGNPSKNLIEQSIAWIGYKKVTVKEYDYILNLIALNNKIG